MTAIASIIKFHQNALDNKILDDAEGIIADQMITHFGYMLRLNDQQLQGVFEKCPDLTMDDLIKKCNENIYKTKRELDGTNNNT